MKIVQEYPGSIHVLLADMLMPGMTGREVADHLLPVRQRMKVLFMSGQSTGTIERAVRHPIFQSLRSIR